MLSTALNQLSRLSSNRKSRYVPRRTCYVGARAAFQPAEFFKSNPKLVDKRKSSKGIHFILLEGPAGSGKGSVLERLSKLGYQTISVPFIKHCELTRDRIKSESIASDASVSWMNRLQSEMKERALTPKDVKDLVIFVNRSPFTPMIYNQQITPPSDFQQMKAFCASNDTFQAWSKEHLSYSVILCDSDFLRRQERLGERVLYSSGETATLRTLLGEDDMNFQKQMATRYQAWADQQAFDDVIPTTDSKQGVARILSLYGLSDWEAFKKGVGYTPQPPT